MPLVSNVVDHMSRFPPYTTNKGVGAIIPEELASGHLVHDNNTSEHLKGSFEGACRLVSGSQVLIKELLSI